MAAVTKTTRPSALPRPLGFEVHPSGAGWEVRPEGGKRISQHAQLADAIALARSMAKRAGAAVRLHDGVGGVQTVPAW